VVARRGTAGSFMLGCKCEVLRSSRAFAKVVPRTSEAAAGALYFGGAQGQTQQGKRLCAPVSLARYGLIGIVLLRYCSTFR
jgi:hypothetical protein